MRALQLLVAVQAILLAVLLGAWARRGDAALPPPSTPPATAAPDRLTPAAAAAGAAPAPIAAQAERSAAAPPAGADAAAMPVILQGRLTGVSPPPPSDAVRLWLRGERFNRFAEVAATGAYAIAGLSPGPWTVHCEVDGCRLVEFAHTLTSEPIQRLDLALEPATVLTVFVRTQDDQRLAAELAKLGIWQGLRVVATLEPLLGDFAPTEHSSIGDVGVGRHRQPSDLNRRAEPDGDDGVLELDQPPPVHAALLLRHLVLAQQRIEPGQRELRFVVDLADVTARFATVRLRVLGPGGAPVPAASIELSTAQGGGRRGRTDEQGVAVVANVLPGLASFEISGKDVEHFRSHLTIPSGGELDLGDVMLTAPAELLGRVVDQGGAPTAATLQWTALDQWRPPHPLIDRHSTSSDGDGNCQLWGSGRRRYTVSARTDDGRVGFALVDGAAQGTERFVVTVRPAHTLRLDARAAGGVRCAVVADANGTPLQVRRLELRWPESSVALPDGDYEVLVYDPGGTQLHRESLQVAGADLTRVLP